MSADEREVTDPITHLPVKVKDFTDKDIEEIPPSLWNDADHSSTDSEQDKSAQNSEQHANVTRLVDQEVSQGWWSNPKADANRARIGKALVAGSAAGFGSLVARLSSESIRGRFARWLLSTLFGSVALSLAIFLVFVWYEPRWVSPQDFREQEPKERVSKSTTKMAEQEHPESAVWLNSLLKSLWPIVNPSLFTSIADMLEDSLSATLPSLVNGVRVADIGQGSEPVRILGIRWLAAGDAAVAKEGMQAEEGDFMNLELAFAYRADRTTNESKGLKSRQRNPHLLIQFFTKGGIRLPVWVELTAILATARVRIQLTPNPPFVSVATMAFLGQPKVSLSCIPLAKQFLNIMDIPGLSNYMQRCIQQVMSEYVSPKSVSLDLKAMLMGRPKMDTDAAGVMIITVKTAEGFRDGDGGKIWKSEDGKHGDAYMTVGWGKWGKDMWSSRIIQKENHPIWEESTALLVGPNELNAQEHLRLQLWDSDRNSADDLLGTVEVPLQDLMTSEDTLNTRSVRTDDFTEKDGSPCPGKLTWEVGYFTKTTLEQHLEHREDADVDELKKRIEREAEQKLREAKPVGMAEETGELQQQKQEDLKERTDEVIANSRPTEEWPSGILGISIEQLTGLEIRATRKSGVEDGPEYEDDDESNDLPSAYCNVTIDHQKVYRTRTKMKTSKPFFNAGTERFIRNWQDTTVIISVRDSRLHEDNPLLGLVAFPLRDVFAKVSQVSDNYPIIGGIASGRLRVALTFRSIQATLPRELLGWEIGTLDIHSTVTTSIDLPADLTTCQLVLRTLHGRGKMKPQQSGGWQQKRDRPIRLPVLKRNSSCLLIQFTKKHHRMSSMIAFSTLWLKDIPDEEEMELTLDVRSNDESAIRRARMNASSEIGEKVGTINVKLRYWRGMSSYHQKLASGNKHMKDVMESLDCLEDEKKAGKEEDDEYDSQASFDSSEEGSDDEDGEDDRGNKGDKGDGSKSGLIDHVKSFKEKQSGELNRTHRGLMQYGPARKVAWMRNSAQRQVQGIENKVKGISKHQQADQAVEREV